jgi:hypothetical protein
MRTDRKVQFLPVDQLTLADRTGYVLHGGEAATLYGGGVHRPPTRRTQTFAALCDATPGERRTSGDASTTGHTAAERAASLGQRGDGDASSRASERRGGEPASIGTAEPSRDREQKSRAPRAFSRFLFSRSRI